MTLDAKYSKPHRPQQDMSSISSLPDHPTHGPSSPRSLLACKKAAVVPDDLIYRDISYFKQKFKDPAIAQMHF